MSDSCLDLLELDPALLPLETTPLHLAANNNSTDAVVSLLERHNQYDSLNVLDRHGRTPLCVAMQNGRFKVAQLLIEAGSKLDAKYVETGLTITEALVEPVFWPVLEGVLPNVENTSLGGSNFLGPASVSFLQHLLVSSASNCDNSAVEMVLERYEVDVDWKDSMGRTALHYATQNGYLTTTMILLKSGATVTPQDSSGSTALHLACAEGHRPLLKLLLQEETSPDPEAILKIQDSRLRTCAHVALYNRHFKSFELLVTKFRAHLDLSLRDDSGHTLPGLLFYIRVNLSCCLPPLPYLSIEEATWTLNFAIYGGDLEVVRRCLAEGAELCTFDHTGHAPLMLAASLGELEICKELGEAGADPNIASPPRADGVVATPLHCAFTAAQGYCAPSHTPSSHFQDTEKHVEIVEYLFSLPNINPVPLYHSVSNPLTPRLLEIILEYFSCGSLRVRKPSHWQKWLSLAARSPKILPQEFSKLANAICPPNWLEILSNGAYELEPKAVKQHTYTSQPCLPAYCESKPEENGRRRSSRARRRSYDLRQKLERSPQSMVFSELQSPPKSFKPKRFEKYYEERKLRKLESCYYPLHEAAENGNPAVIELILEEANLQNSSLPNKLLFEAMDDAGRRVAELMARKFDLFQDSLDSVFVEHVGDHFGFSLPENMNYEHALLHYIVATGGKKLRVQHLRKTSKSRPFHYSHTPLDKWPLWYSDLMFLRHLRDLAIDTGEDTPSSPQYLSEEGRRVLITHLLNNHGLLEDSIFASSGHLGLLAIAAKAHYPWAVEYLVMHGASPLKSYHEIKKTSFRTRFSLLDEAIVQNVESLGVTAETLTLSDIQIISPALLAKAGDDTDISAVETLYHKLFHGSSKFWSTRYGPRLVYILLSRGDCDSFASEVVMDMIATISHQIFTTKACIDIKAVLCLFKTFVSPCLRSARAMLPSQYQEERDLEGVHLALRLVCFILGNGGPIGIGFEFFFHSLCWLGIFDLVQFFAETVCLDTLTLALSKLENNMSPLYFAAVNGHVGVVKYLMNKGCPVLHSDPSSPPILLAALLHNRKCLASSLHKSGCNTDLFGELRPKVISWLWMDNLHQVFTESDRANAFELLQFLTAECDILDIVRHKNWFSVFLGLIAVSLRSDTIEALLERLHEVVHLPESVAVKISEEKLNHIIKLSRINVSDTFPTFLQLFDDIVVKSMDAVPSSKFVVLAARSGLWKTVSSFFSSGQIQPIQDLSSKDLSLILSYAVKQGVFEVLTLISSSLEQSGGLHFEHLIDPVCTAAECGESAVDAWNILLCLKPLQSTCSESLGTDFYAKPLCKAIRLHNDSLTEAIIDHLVATDEPIPTPLVSLSLEAAARSNNQYAIKKLHSLQLTRNLDLSPFEDATLSFWSCVLLGAASCGHEELSLEAIGYLSESHLNKLMENIETSLKLLNYCCWWGLKDVLECLPISSSRLFLTASGNGDLPWFSAACNGQAGKLSSLDAFPSLGEVSDIVRSSKHDDYFLSDQNRHFLLNGAFHKLLSSRGYECSMANHKFFKFQLDKAHFFANQVCLGLLEPVAIYLEHLGKYAGDFIADYVVPRAVHITAGDRKPRRSLLSVACSKSDNLGVVELILKALFNSSVGLSGGKYTSEFVLCLRRGEVEYARAFVQSIPNVVEKSSNSHNLLNEAVRSDNPEMVDYVISLLGDAAPDECYRMDENYEYPLFSAFSFRCSRVVVESSLMETAETSLAFYNTSLHPDWRRAARKAIGWFDLMMHSHAKIVEAHALERGLSRKPSYPILGSTPEAELATMPRYPMMCLKEAKVNSETILMMFLHLSVVHKLPSMTSALILSSVCSVDLQFLELKHFQTLHEIFNNPVFLEPPVHCQATSFLRVLSQKFSMKVLSELMITNLLKNSINQEKTILLLDEFLATLRKSPDQETLKIETLKSVFTNACWFGSEKVVDLLLSLGEDAQLHDGILEEGMQLAVSGGKLSLAASLKQRLKSPAPFLPENPIHQCIFTETSYYDVLNSFFTSLCLPCQRSPLAASWIMREWSEAEAQLVVQQFTLSTYAPPNPWTVPLGSRELVVTVDWDSFSECLLTSPSAAFCSAGDSLGSKFRNVPLLVEAIVFSQAVLGQLVSPMCSKEGSQPWHSVLCSRGGVQAVAAATEGLSALIVSCVVWPATPSFTTFGGDQGILTISYQPHTRTVVFPDTFTHHSTEKEESRFFHDQDFCYPVSARFEDLSAYYEKIIGQLTKSAVVVEFDSEILEGEFEDVDLRYSLASGHLSDIIKALTVSLQLFTKQYEGKKGWSQALFRAVSSSLAADSSTTTLQSVFDSVRICFGAEPEVATVYEVVSEGGALDIRTHLPIGVGDFADSDLSFQPHYTGLVDQLLESIARAKVALTQSQIVDKIGTRVASLLKSSLKLASASSDMFKLSVETKEGVVTKFSEFDPTLQEDCVYFKILKKLKHFLCSFCRMLKVFQYQPKLRSSISGLFEAGLHVTLCAALPPTQGPKFSIKSRTPHLAISVPQLLSPSGLSTARASIKDSFQSVLEVSLRNTGGRNMTTPLILSPPKGFPPPGVPAPFACHVDLNQAEGLLYPVLEKTGQIVVQLVDFTGKPLTMSPSVNCHLDVRIRHLGSTDCVTMATSSGDPNPQSASRHLLVMEGTNGTFNIVWTPQDSGFHLVALAVNKQSIGLSPYRVFVADPDSGIFGRGPGSGGLRQTNTDQPVVFVARHEKHCCCNISNPPPVHLFNKKPFPIPDLETTLKLESQEEFLQRLEKENGRIHHISMCSAYGGAASQKWLRLPSAALSVHIHRESDNDSTLSIKSFQMDVTPLGNGFYRVSLLPRVVGSYSLFVSCSCCHSVLKVLWKSGGCGLRPTSLYVVSGRISQQESALRVVRPPRRRPRRKDKHILCSAQAGSTLLFHLEAADVYGNRHTTGGAIKAAVIWGAGRRETPAVGDWFEGDEEQNQPLLVNSGSDAICDVSYTSGGCYEIKCKVYTVGTHELVLADSNESVYSSRRAMIFGKIRVFSGAPSGSKCRLCDSNVYAGTVGMRQYLFLELFDEFGNHSHFSDGTTEIEARVGSHVMSACTVEEAIKSEKKRGVSVAPPPNYGIGSNNHRHFVALAFTPYQVGVATLNVQINGTLLPNCPVPFSVRVSIDYLVAKVTALRTYLRSQYGRGYTPTITVDRSRLLESAVEALQDQMFLKTVRVRFGDERGMDMGGISKEFFHLLSLEFVNPDIALFQQVSGFYKPNPRSSANENHLFYFTYFGKILAKAICDGHQIPVRFAPSVYKYLLRLECTIDDLKLEDPTVHRSLVDILSCENDEDLELLATNFTATSTHFGLVETVELGVGGEGRRVTMDNRAEFVQKLLHWLLTGCISSQLNSLYSGFTSLIPYSKLLPFQPVELELLLSGPVEISIPFIKKQTGYTGYSADSIQVQWLWEVLEGFSQEERSMFLRFCTGSGSLPIKGVESWKFKVQKGSEDASQLPAAATCFNSLQLPLYTSQTQLRRKLLQAVLYGNQGFLLP